MRSILTLLCNTAGDEFGQADLSTRESLREQ